MKSLRIAAVAAGLAAVVGIAPGVHAQGAEKFDLVGPNANVRCAPPHDPLDTPAVTDFGFVIFDVDRQTDRLKTLVAIKNGEPNTRYVVRVIQDNSDCYTQDGVVTTNVRGRGFLNLSEKVRSTAAQVIIDTGSMFNSPTYRAEEAFVHPGTAATRGEDSRGILEQQPDSAALGSLR